MKRARLLIACALVAATAGFGGCTLRSGPVIAPETREVATLEGTTVQLVVGQALDIDTGDVAVDSYQGEVEDPSIAEFVAGREEGGPIYNPGVKALAAGTTTVELSTSEAGADDVTFTVEVTTPGQGGS